MADTTTAQQQHVSPVAPQSMEEVENDFGYHPKGTSPSSLEAERRRREQQTFGHQLKTNLPMTIATSSVCGVLLYGLWKSLLSNDTHNKQARSQAKWMGFRVMTQGAAFVTLFGFAIYSGRLWTEQVHPLQQIERDNAAKLKV